MTDNSSTKEIKDSNANEFNVLIVAVNSKYVHTLLSPYYLKSNSGEFENSIEILQTNINVDIVALKNSILSTTPKVIAFPCYIFNITYILKLCDLLKKEQNDFKIVFGGPEVSFESENYSPYCDYIITGEGETSFKNLIFDLSYNQKNVQNPIKIDRIIKGIPKSFNELNTPYSKQYFIDTYQKIAYFEASRGCPFACSYCMSGKSFLQLDLLNRVCDNLLLFKDAKIRVLKFVDRTFNCNREYANQILNFIVENQNSFQFTFHFEIAPELISNEMLEIIKKARVGLLQFEIGFQSCNKDTLNAINRSNAVEKSLENIKKITTLGNCHIHTDLIAGLPLESFSSFKKSFNMLFAAGGNQIQLGFLKVLKGSELASNLQEGYEYEKTPPYEILKTPWLTTIEIEKLKCAEAALDKLFNSLKFTFTLNFLFDKCPDAFQVFLEFGILLKEKYRRFYCIETNEIFASLKHFLLQKNFEINIVNEILKLDYITSFSDKILPKCIAYNHSKQVSHIKSLIKNNKGRAVADELFNTSQVRDNCQFKYILSFLSGNPDTTILENIVSFDKKMKDKTNQVKLQIKDNKPSNFGVFNININPTNPSSARKNEKIIIIDYLKQNQVNKKYKWLVLDE